DAVDYWGQIDVIANNAGITEADVDAMMK
nr:3-oxoacyl-[acyl-carrier-protein] reductase (EC 1.1.1.100) - rape [Brassica napus]